MISLELQVTSLEPSKRLKELGVKQDSVYYWSKCLLTSSTMYGMGEMGLMYGYGNPPSDDVENYSAFTVAELGEALPRGTHTFKFAENDYRVWGETITFSETKEADARAKMRIYLIENKLMGGSK